MCQRARIGVAEVECFRKTLYLCLGEPVEKFASRYPIRSHIVHNRTFSIFTGGLLMMAVTELGGLAPSGSPTTWEAPPLRIRTQAMFQRGASVW
jgi:hypothetical protein